jgi:hypothetical protein
VDRDEESFDLDDEFAGESDSGGDRDLDRFMDRVNKKVKPAAKRGKAAWSQLEDVLADRRLKRQLDDFDYDEV